MKKKEREESMLEKINATILMAPCLLDPVLCSFKSTIHDLLGSITEEHDYRARLTAGGCSPVTAKVFERDDVSTVRSLMPGKDARLRCSTPSYVRSSYTCRVAKYRFYMHGMNPRTTSLTV